MNPLKQLLGQSAIYGLSSVVGRLLNYLLVPLYTRVFSTFEYGEVSVLYAYAALLLVVLTYGMETAFFRFSQTHTPPKAFSTALFSLLISTSAFFCLLGFALDPIAQALSFGHHPEYIQYVGLIVGLDALTCMAFAKLRQEQKAWRFASIRLVNILINIGLNLFFILYCPYVLSQGTPNALISAVYNPELGIAYIFIANLVASAITFVILLPQLLDVDWRFDRSLWLKMMPYALPLMFAGLAGMVNETLDRVLLNSLLPSDVASSEVGLYSAFYKLSIIMTLFIQTFRFAAEPFFFAQEKNNAAKAIYAKVMKYFFIVTAFIFLSVCMYFDLVKQFIGSDFHDERGGLIVPILLLANLFLGVYYNLSIWYKLSEKTIYGAWMSLFGAGITIGLNLWLIPILGFVGSAWATLSCYALMVVLSYFLGRKHYPIPYPLARITTYFVLMMGLYALSTFWPLGMAANTFYLVTFISLVWILERPKKTVTS
ncbi:MAG: oligosaccharide flippase family protein [Bacteroidota bacterium]|nr:oligosaccharide flippase family protein [Bacteroidota bacterium]